MTPARFLSIKTSFFQQADKKTNGEVDKQINIPLHIYDQDKGARAR